MHTTCRDIQTAIIKTCAYNNALFGGAVLLSL